MINAIGKLMSESMEILNIKITVDGFSFNLWAIFLLTILISIVVFVYQKLMQ